MSKQILNIDELEYLDLGHGDRFAARMGPISRKIGARGLGYNLTVVPAGKRAFPFHSHRVNDEMFFVIEGSALAVEQAHDVFRMPTAVVNPAAQKTAQAIDGVRRLGGFSGQIFNGGTQLRCHFFICIDAQHPAVAAGVNRLLFRQPKTQPFALQ